MIDEKNNNLPELPEGWVCTRLEDILVEVENVNPKDTPNKEFDYIDIASIDNHQKKIQSPKRYIGKNAPSRARQIVKSGDILFSTVRTYLENIAMVNEIYDGQIASTGFCVIRPHKSIDNKMLFYWVQADTFLNQLNQIQRGTSYPAVRNSDVHAQAIPLPSPTEQHRIVAKIEELFTKLDAGVESLEKAKAQLKRYRHSVLKAAVEGKLTKEWRETHKGELEPASVLLERILKERREKWEAEQLVRMKAKYRLDTDNFLSIPEGWVWTLLVNLLSDNPQNGIYKSAKFFDEFQGVRLLDIKGLYRGFHVDFQGSRRVKLNSEEIEKYSLGDGDLLINRVSKKPEGVGKAALVKNLGELTVFESNMIRVRFNNNFVFSPFINYFLNSMEGRTQVLQKAKMTQQASINQSDVKSIVLLLPPLPEQHKIVEEVEQRLSIVEKVETFIEANLKRAERLRQSILKQAFSGKLVPQDPNDEPAIVLLSRIKEEKAKRKQKQKTKTTPRRKKMKKVQNDKEEDDETIDLCSILQKSKEPLALPELWQASKLDIEDFYAQLKSNVEAGKIIEQRPNDTDVFLELAK